MENKCKGVFMCEFEWERENTMFAKVKCKYCGKIFIIDYILQISKRYCLCKKCENKIIKNIPKKYKIKGNWRDFYSYSKDYKIKKYRFNQNDVIIENIIKGEL